jgi:hypothetical protein
MRLLLGLLAVCAVWAQRPAFVYVTTPEPRLVSGRSTTAKAVGTDANGGALGNQAWAWSSTDERILTVDSGGNITARMPGIADIAAVSNGVRGTVRLQVLPARIEVLPANQEIAPGDQLQYQARVFNADGQELEGVTVQWTAVGFDGFNNNSIGISRTGALSAFGFGRFQVRAAVTYATGPGQFVSQFIGSTIVNVRLRSGWRLSRLASSGETRDGMLLRSTAYPMAVGPDGLVAVSASLDGVANGVVATRGGALEVWAGSGLPGNRPGTVIMSFEMVAANRLGEVAALSATNGVASFGSGNNVVLVTREGQRFLTMANTSDAGVELIRPSWITRFSLNDGTQCAFGATYRDLATRTDRNGIFTVDTDGAHVLLVPDNTVLPGLTGSYTFERELTYDNSGVLTFIVVQANNRYIYRRTAVGAFERLAGVGDKVEGNTITQANQLAISPNGHLAYHLYSNSSQYLVLRRAGEAARTLALGDLNQVYDVSSTGEVLYYGNGGSGSGLYVWDGMQSRAITLIGRPTPNDDPLTNLTSAAFGAGSDIIVQGVTPRRDLLVFRASPNPAVLFESGSRTAGVAGLTFETLVLGAKRGSPYLRSVTTRSGAIEAGTSIAIIAPGDRLPDGGRYDGSFLQRSPDGDLLLSTSTSLQRLNPAASRTLMRFPYAIDDGTLFNANQAAANATGTTAVFCNTSFPSSRLLLVENGTPRLIAHIGGADPNFRTQSPTGGVFSGLRQLWVDDAGRVLALMDVNGGPMGVFAYQQSNWQPLLVAGNKIDGATVAGIDLLRIAGNRAYVRYSLAGNFVHIAAEDGGVFTRRFGRGDDAPTGNIMNNPGTFDVFPDGQIAVSYSAGGLVGLAVQRAGEALRAVWPFNAPTDEGDFLIQLESIDVREDGRIYFTAFTDDDRWVAYVAEPIQ